MDRNAAFLAALARHNSTGTQGRRWLFVPMDQLSDGIGPLAREAPERLGIVLVESHRHAMRRPWHRMRLALCYANQRHFAVEQAARGVAVRYHFATEPIAEVLRAEALALGGLAMMEAAERELRVQLAPLAEAGAIAVLPHEGWLTTEADFLRAGGPPWRMDAFYRQVRRRTGFLMGENGKPIGGRFSFDGENRHRWDGIPAAPEPPRFAADPIRDEVAAYILEAYPRHPGEIDAGALPATKADAETLWAWAKRECLEHFGPYEDAMSTRSSGLFHSRISALMNLHRILPRMVVEDVLDAEIPLPSKEGFLRQVIGWREFVHHVHRATDGFRQLPQGAAPVASAPGDGGWSQWSGEPWAAGGEAALGGSEANFLGADLPVPPAFWGRPSGLACLDGVVADVWREAWSHHITRLMVLSNIATLAGVSPRSLADWFWVAYADAWDWVVEPNVMAMGTFGVGDVMTTKPYVSGSNYINSMSDYCGGCAFDPKKNCPLGPMYWAFLARNEARLEANLRVGPILPALRKRPADRRAEDARVAERVRRALAAGERVDGQ
jgi:deoxyribodipyrimidine photolyase-related protein